LRGGILVDCTKRVGLENEIVGRYLVEQLKMKPIVVLECDDFPSSCSIVDGRPQFPLLIYAAINSKLSILTSDFLVPTTHEKQLARGLISWSKKQSMALIISISLSSQERNSEGNEKIGSDIFTAYSTESAKQRIIQSRTDLISKGVVDGVPAALLTEGTWNNFDVIAIQITPPASPKEIAERTIEALDVILPEVKFDCEAAQMNEKLELGLSDSSTPVGE
jgi:predicted ATP-grasp superfamily ATP-dependent carboligase